MNRNFGTAFSSDFHVSVLTSIGCFSFPFCFQDSSLCLRKGFQDFSCSVGFIQFSMRCPGECVCASVFVCVCVNPIERIFRRPCWIVRFESEV